MRIWMSLILVGLLIGLLPAQENVHSLNLQFHYDFRRDHPTVTQEYFGTDGLGYTFFFMDINFDHYYQSGGVSDIYFEFMRYFKLARWKSYDVYFTLQYDDGTPFVNRVVLAGLNLGNIRVGPLNISTEFLFKKDYQLDVNWQYTVVWFSEFMNGKLFFNGFFDYWANDVDNSHWPAGDAEIAATRYSFQAEPQLGWNISSHWKVGSEVEIGRGFLASVTGRLATTETYKYDRWYLLPTLFVRYDF